MCATRYGRYGRYGRQRRSGGAIREEYCSAYEAIVPHRVTVEIREGRSEEAIRRGTGKYSRGPYRATECCQCERSTATRIGNR